MRTGSTEPRVFTPPKRPLTPETTLGFAYVQFVEQVLHLTVLPWERWLALHALELNEDGLLRFRTVVVEIGRQNGKTTFGKRLSLFFLVCLNVPLVIGTAQNIDIAEEVWTGALDMMEDAPELAPLLKETCRVNGKKSFTLTDGQRYKIVASTRKGGRGLSADLVLLDELREHTNFDAWGAITKATMARPDSMVFCMSNAGDAQSVVLRHLRVKAHAALGDPDGIAAAMGEYIEAPEEDISTDTLGWFEWSAPPGCGIYDREAWEAANPSLGYGFLTERALAAAAGTDTEAVFRTECLCQWVEAKVEHPFPDGAWEAGIDPASKIKGEAVFGMDISADRKRTSIGVCGLREDGLYHVEVIASRTGFEWAKEWLSQRGKTRLAIQGRGAPISSYVQDLSDLKNVDLTLCEGRDIGAFTGRFYDGIAASVEASGSDAIPIMHRPQPILDECAQTAQKRSLGDSAFGWDRRNSPDDVSPLVAVTMAFGLMTGGRTEEKTYQSAYQERSLIVV